MLESELWCDHTTEITCGVTRENKEGEMKQICVLHVVSCCCCVVLFSVKPISPSILMGGLVQRNAWQGELCRPQGLKMWRPVSCEWRSIEWQHESEAGWRWRRWTFDVVVTNPGWMVTEGLKRCYKGQCRNLLPPLRSPSFSNCLCTNLHKLICLLDMDFQPILLLITPFSSLCISNYKRMCLCNLGNGLFIMKGSCFVSSSLYLLAMPHKLWCFIPVL